MKRLFAAILCVSIIFGLVGRAQQSQLTYVSMTDFDDAQWWKQFGDPILDSLIERGLKNNYDVLTAAKRVSIAQNTLKQTRSSYYPSFGLNIGWNNERTSGRLTSAKTAASTMSYVDAGINMSWEIDLFGRITARANESKAQLRVSRAEYAGTMVSLQAQIATAYFDLRVYQAQLEISQRHADSQLNVVKITEARHQTGLASQLDVAQAKTVYYSTLASIPQIKNNIGSTISAIALLLGLMPDALNEELASTQPLPSCPTLQNFNIPMSTIERRPDMVEAQQNIEAMAAALGVAKKDYLPMLQLTGSIGTQGHRFNDLFTKDSFTYSLVPTLSWTIFDGLSRRAGVQIARENMDIEIDSYNNTLINAVNEAENAMGNYFTEMEYIDNISQVVEYALQAEQLSLQLYKQGLGTFTDVDNSLISLLSYELEAAQAQGTALNYLVALYKALGGGWNADVNQ